MCMCECKSPDLSLSSKSSIFKGYILRLWLLCLNMPAVIDSSSLPTELHISKKSTQRAAFEERSRIVFGLRLRLQVFV